MCTWALPHAVCHRVGNWHQYQALGQSVIGGFVFLFLLFQSSCSLSLHPMSSGSLSLLRSWWEEVVKPSQPVAPAFWSKSCLFSAALPRGCQLPLGESCWWGRDGVGRVVSGHWWDFLGGPWHLGTGQKSENLCHHLFGSSFPGGELINRKKKTKKTPKNLPFVNFVLYIQDLTLFSLSHSMFCSLQSFFLIWLLLHPFEREWNRFYFHFVCGKSLGGCHTFCDVGGNET